MNDVPLSIKRILEKEKFKCSSCGNFFTIQDLNTIGIKESSLKPHNDSLVLGLFCKKCRELMLFEVAEMGLMDLAFEVLENETNDQVKQKEKDLDEELLEDPKEEEPKKNNRKKGATEEGKSKITLQELKRAEEFLKTNKFHEDFLIVLGMTPEEIEKYKIKK